MEGSMECSMQAAGHNLFAGSEYGKMEKSCELLRKYLKPAYLSKEMHVQVCTSGGCKRASRHMYRLVYRLV